MAGKSSTAGVAIIPVLFTTERGTLDANISSRLATAGYTAPTTPPTVTAIRMEMDANSTKLANLDASVSSRSTSTAADVWSNGTRTLSSFGTLVSDTWANATRSLTDKAGFSLSMTPPTAVQIRTEMDSNSTKLVNLDASVSSRLAASTYLAPDNTGIASIKSKTDSLSFTGTDVNATLDSEPVAVSDKPATSWRPPNILPTQRPCLLSTCRVS